MSLWGCGAAPVEAGPGADRALAREAAELSARIPDCALVTSCPIAGADPAGCVDNAAWFQVVVVEDQVVDVTLAPEVDTASSDGWYTAVGSPEDCSGVVLFAFGTAPDAPVEATP